MRELCTNCHTGHIYELTKRLDMMPPLCLNCYLKAYGYLMTNIELVRGLTNEGLDLEEASEIVAKQFAAEIEKQPVSAANSISHLVDTLETWLAEQTRPANVSDLKRKAQ